MREMLFRGKLKGRKVWAEGNLYIDGKGVCIITPDETVIGKYGQVDPETVGQYTGLTDKNGKKIFEGDIVNAAIETEWCDEQGYRAEIETMTGIVQWDRFSACWMIRGIENGHIAFCDMLSTEAHLFEVIGNIHDNPELLDEVRE